MNGNHRQTSAAFVPTWMMVGIIVSAVFQCPSLYAQLQESKSVVTAPISDHSVSYDFAPLLKQLCEQYKSTPMEKSELKQALRSHLQTAVSAQYRESVEWMDHCLVLVGPQHEHEKFAKAFKNLNSAKFGSLYSLTFIVLSTDSVQGHNIGSISNLNETEYLQTLESSYISNTASEKTQHEILGELLNQLDSQADFSVANKLAIDCVIDGVSVMLQNELPMQKTDGKWGLPETTIKKSVDIRLSAPGTFETEIKISEAGVALNKDTPDLKNGFRARGWALPIVLDRKDVGVITVTSGEPPVANSTSVLCAYELLYDGMQVFETGKDHPIFNCIEQLKSSHAVQIPIE